MLLLTIAAFVLAILALISRFDTSIETFDIFVSFNLRGLFLVTAGIPCVRCRTCLTAFMSIPCNGTVLAALFVTTS